MAISDQTTAAVPFWWVHRNSVEYAARPGLYPKDANALIDLHRGHWNGRPWRHNCGTPAGYGDCNEDADSTAEDLVKELRTEGWKIDEEELRRLWEVDDRFHCPPQ